MTQPDYIGILQLPCLDAMGLVFVSPIRSSWTSVLTGTRVHISGHQINIYIYTYIYIHIHTYTHSMNMYYVSKRKRSCVSWRLFNASVDSYKLNKCIIFYFYSSAIFPATHSLCLSRICTLSNSIEC